MAKPKDMLLILGGSNCQVNAFRRAKAQGVPTVLFDYLENPPAAALAGQHIRASTFDVESCLREAAKLPLAGVMTLGTDQPVYTAARIAEKLGLPHLINTDTAFAVTNKSRMKTVLEQAGLPTARWWLAGSASQLAALPTAGPVVIKPQDSQGQKGVFRAGSPTKAAALFGASIAYSRLGALVCEEYYPSDEITASAWVHAGKTTTLAVTDRLHLPGSTHIGICAAHRYPSRAAHGLLDEIDALCQKVATAFGIQNGPLYIQFLHGRRGLLINELACRIGGAFEDVFIPYLTGFDILGAVMQAALGGPPARPLPFDAGTKQARVLFPFARPGAIAAMPPLAAVKALPCVADAGYNMAPGHTVPPLENAGERLAHVVLLAQNEEEMQAALETFYGTFYVRDEKGADMLLPAAHGVY